MKVNELSVFFPCINEEGNVRTIVNNAIQVLEQLRLKYEIIIVNDGSSDNTGGVARQLIKENPNIRVIDHPKNLGYGEALKSGFYNARYNTVVYTDGDGQFDFSEVTKFLEKIDTHDVVIGYRLKRQDSFIRKFFGKGWRLTLLTFFRITLKDVDCGFKMVRKEVLEKIPHLESSRGAMINAELVIKAKKAGFRIAQVGVAHYPRLSGRPTGANIKVIIKSYLDLIRLWWKLKDNKMIFVAIIGVLVLGALLRFWNLSGYMTFLGDEGRDAIFIKDLLVKGNLPFIGPPTSVGNIYLGPFYYYMMAVPMAIFWLNPVAAAGMNALLGVATVALIYYLGKSWFNKYAGLIAAFLYSISPVTIIYSRSSWNPNPAPFFALLSILGLYRVNVTKNYKWLALTGFAAAAAVQMHYLALILLPVLLVVWIKEFMERRQGFWSGTALAVIVFLLMLSPLAVFDLRHDFLNFKAITALFFGKDSAVGFDIFSLLDRIKSIYTYNLIGRYITAENPLFTALASMLVLVPLIINSYLTYKKKPFNWGLWVLTSWLLMGVVVLAFYKQNIYDHYLGFLNPAPYLLLGSLAVIRMPVYFKRYWGILIFILVMALIVLNLQKNPLQYAPQNQLGRTQDVAKFIISQTGGKDFNFALLAKNNYDSAYQFYLDIYGHKPKQVPFAVTDQLFVVCEDAVCDPTYNPKYEVAAFGMSKIDWVKEFDGVKIYKLSHNPGGRPQ